MLIKKLSFNNFRNYEDLQLSFDTDTIIFYGGNANGKTNILEGIYLCSCLRSHRTYRDQELIMKGEDNYKVCLDFVDTYEEEGLTKSFQEYIENIEVSYTDLSKQIGKIKEKRVLTYNDVKIAKMSDFVGIFNAVIFAPEDMNLIKEGPSTRRRFIDILISQIRPSYFNELSTFQRLLSNRNAQLKIARDSQKQEEIDNIDIWDTSLAYSAARIISTRKHFASRVEYFASAQHSKMSNGKEKINVKYKTITGINEYNNIENMKNYILRKLSNDKKDDIFRGSTSIGPHRDDLDLILNGESIRIFGSQGQQRTLVLSLKIAELEIIKEETRRTPILLLDDVMSELDENRRRALISSIDQAQVFITCTDIDHASPEYFLENTNRKISCFKVERGQVKEEECNNFRRGTQ